MSLIPQFPAERVAGATRYLRNHDERFTRAKRPAYGSVLDQSLADLRRVARERVQRPYFAQVLGLDGNESLEELCVRFAQFRSVLGLPPNAAADAMLALEQQERPTLN